MTPSVAVLLRGASTAETEDIRNMSVQLSVIVIICIISVILHVCSSQLQQQVQFFPINNWDCSHDTEKICVVDQPSETVQTSSLTECTMNCWMKIPECLQFNYYSSSVTSPNCALYYFRPTRYDIVDHCQHYVVKQKHYAFKYQYFVSAKGSCNVYL